MKKQNRDQKRKQFKYEINKNKKKKLVDPDALNDKGDNKTLRELAGLGAVLGAGAAGMAFMPNNTVHAAEQTAADQKSAVVGSVSANKIQNEGSVAQEQNNSKTQLDKTVNSEDKESSSTTSDVKSESTNSVLSSENKSNHKSKLTDSVSSVNDNSKSIASTSSVSNNSKSIASISSVNSNSNNNSASAVSTRLSNISDSIISNNSNESLSSLKANNENSSSLSYRTPKNSNLKVLLATNSSVERQTIKTHDQDVSNKLTNVDTTLSYFSYSGQSQTIESGQTPTINPEMSEGLHTNISFTVPKDVGAGDFFDISWSNNMNIYGTHDLNDSSYDTEIQITDQEGKVIAKEDKSNSPVTGNKVRLVFTDYVNTHNNVSGNINFNLFIDPKNVPNDSTETLKVGIGNQQISRKVDVQYTAIKRGTVSISNRYYYDLANGEAFITKTNFTDHKVTSVVYVNPLGYDLRNGVSVDIQNLENSDINFLKGGPLQYKVYRINDDAKPNQSFYIDPSQVTDVTGDTYCYNSSDNKILTIVMPTNDPYEPGYEPSNSRYIITYTTTYNSNTQTQQGKYEVPLKTRTTISTTTDDGVDNSFYWDNLNTYHPGSESGSGTPAQSASASASRASYSASESASQASHSASESASQASHSASVSASQSASESQASAASLSHESQASRASESQASAASLSH
ncbi:Ig-like domain-containing protein, partial [Lactobacillus kitasatonis]|uniref:Ig-like domain-containing protein n=1 Tax=Lactobacillus kitasatonis TaxID=237446 RepID=UPI0026E98C73